MLNTEFQAGGVYGRWIFCRSFWLTCETASARFSPFTCKWLDRRIGRNESFYHAGNVVSALSAGLLGYLLSQSWIFYVVAALSVASALTAFAISGDEIDYELARGGAHLGNGNANDGSAQSRC